MVCAPMRRETHFKFTTLKVKPEVQVWSGGFDLEQ